MYESHITVQGIEYNEFAEICKEIGLKPIHIQMDTGSGMDQMMSSKFHKTSCDEALKELSWYASQLPGVTRRKLELILGKNTQIPSNVLYQEFHSKFLMSFELVDSFLAISKNFGIHTSKNVAKTPLNPDETYFFATTRDEKTMSDFLESLPSQYKFVNSIAECVIFDDNPLMDINWNCFDCPLKQRVLHE